MSTSRVLGLLATLRRTRAARLATGACLLATIGVGGCAQSPQQLAAASHGKEYFPESTYGRASRRVVADGQPIPHGGGQYLVGKPYTIAGQTYYPSERRITQVGNASWYGDAFHGRLTANGEIYDRDGFTAAHPTMPLPSYARVTNLRNNASMIVRVNDRGPYHSNRVMDVSRRVAEALDFKRYGTARVKVEYVGRASLAGSDDARLLATLNTDGPARWQGEPGEPPMVAETAPPARVASLAPYAPAQHPARFAGRDDNEMPAPPRRRLVVLPPEPRPDTRFAARPVAVEAAYQRYGTVRQERRPQVAIDRAEPYPVAHAEIRRHDDSRYTRVAERDAPHLPIRDLLPPPRHADYGAERGYEARGDEGRGRGWDEPVPPSRRTGRTMVPPQRPLYLATIPSAESRIAPRRVAYSRYRDE